ncbi:poly(ADP-ribose) glycohydrolase [Anthonomus grandis grandis]|uniref:poly(ADP-ribose) glycohydrolase n=1 Tax=Anthonomus grandis grandis TaxID=2921223 RepID=UPI002165EF1A|nr:poly(ADP-ribose) glycohydrolase [Anthonomus grandis grandis]
MSESTITQPKTWRGTSIKDICGGKGPWSFTVTPLSPSKYHSVLYELPATLDGPPIPRVSKEPHLWHEDHVRMPFSTKNLFSVDEINIKERWKLIQDALKQPITNSKELESALKKYNRTLPNFGALHYFLHEELGEEESEQFFKNLLPNIISLALRLPELLPSGIPLLKQNHNRSLSMSQQQVSCILANAFLCTFPWKQNVAASYPGVNFVSLFSAFQREKRKDCVCEKLKCICNYFRRVTQNVPLGTITFERKFIPRSNMPRWDTLKNNLGNTRIHLDSEGTIEENGRGFLQVDFANKNIGGGVLAYGCVQEEIRFAICPELIAARLFVEQLGNGEAVIIIGTERFNSYTGYGDTFEWSGDYRDVTPRDIYGRLRTSVCVIDATMYHRPKEQFSGSQMIRELNKAYVGFHSRDPPPIAPVATGNWGCGAFRGSKQLKSLIQLIACAAAGRDMVYYSFGDTQLVEEFYYVHLFFGNNQITIAQLWRLLGQFASKNLSEDKLFSFIQQAHFESKNQPNKSIQTITKFFTKKTLDSPRSRNSSSPSKASQEKPVNNNKKEPAEIPMDLEENAVESLSPCSDDVVESSQPEESPYFKKLMVKVQSSAKKRSIEEKLPKTDLSRIFEMLDDEGNNCKETGEEHQVPLTEVIVHRSDVKQS